MRPLAMLAAVEARLEEVIAAAAMRAPDIVQSVEQAQERERRRVRRAHPLVESLSKHEQRHVQSMARRSRVICVSTAVLRQA